MFKPLMIVLMFVFLTACSTTGKNKQDPWEGWNRGVYKLNKAVDKVTKPVAQGYRYVTPDVVETGISNIFSNIGDIPNMLNNLLQGKFVDSASDLGRFLVNSTIGLAGIWDPASSMGLEKHDEDFGQTLATWGVKPGPYVMLPFLGPSTFRDTIAFPVDNLLDPLNEVEHVPTRNQIRFVDLVELRASLLSYDEQLQGQMDEYAFIRDVYLQNRQFKVLDGEIAFDDDDEEDDEWE
jgi:phospholipid-binding lipoprotein MlaA